MLDSRCECKMCTFGTVSSSVSREGQNHAIALKRRAKTAAQINVQEAIHLNEFRHVCSGYLEFYTNRARPPNPSPSGTPGRHGGGALPRQECVALGRSEPDRQSS